MAQAPKRATQARHSPSPAALHCWCKRMPSWVTKGIFTVPCPPSRTLLVALPRCRRQVVYPGRATSVSFASRSVSSSRRPCRLPCPCSASGTLIRSSVPASRGYRYAVHARCSLSSYPEGQKLRAENARRPSLASCGKRILLQVRPCRRNRDRQCTAVHRRCQPARQTLPHPPYSHFALQLPRARTD